MVPFAAHWYRVSRDIGTVGTGVEQKGGTIRFAASGWGLTNLSSSAHVFYLGALGIAFSSSYTRGCNWTIARFLAKLATKLVGGTEFPSL